MGFGSLQYERGEVVNYRVGGRRDLHFVNEIRTARGLSQLVADRDSPDPESQEKGP